MLTYLSGNYSRLRVFTIHTFRLLVISSQMRFGLVYIFKVTVFAHISSKFTTNKLSILHFLSQNVVIYIIIMLHTLTCRSSYSHIFVSALVRNVILFRPILNAVLCIKLCSPLSFVILSSKLVLFLMFEFTLQ